MVAQPALPYPMRVFLWVATGLSVLTVGFSVWSLLVAGVTRDDAFKLIGLTLLIGLATVRPVELRPHLRLSLRVVPQLMAAVLLEPKAAIVVAGVGVLIGYLVRMWSAPFSPVDILFNTAQAIVATAVAALIYGLVASISIVPFGPSLALLAAAVGIHLSSTLLVAGALRASGQDTDFRRVFRRLIQSDLLQHIALLVTAMLGVLLAQEQAYWSIPFLVAPLALVERSIVQQRKEAEQKRKLEVMEQVNALKNDFIGAVTHDLRTPLMAIKGFGELLAEHEDEFLDDERRAIKAINANGERLSELIEVLLQLNELDAGMVKLRRAPADVVAVVQKVIDEANYHAQHKGIGISITVTGQPAPFDLDARRIEQVIDNLVGNAIKFAPSGSDIGVNLRFDDEQLVLAVRDNGPGIPPEVLPHVFERFYRWRRVEGDRRQTGGLGLAIAKSIVELHDGTIDVESEVDQGSTFTVTLPRLAPGQAPDAPEQALIDMTPTARPLPNVR